MGDVTIDARVQPIDRDLIVRLTNVGPEALVDFAERSLEDAEQTNMGILGEVPEHKTFVDGRSDPSLDSVTPTSTIVFAFDLTTPALKWIYEQLQTHSPVKTGRYKRSHTFFVDGDAQSSVENVPSSAAELIFAPLVPYARKIERGESKQAPDGVYQVVAEMARRRFGNSINVSFSYRQIVAFGDAGTLPSGKGASRQEDLRQPAIVIEM